MPTLYDLTRSMTIAAPAQVDDIRRAITAAQQRHGTPPSEMFDGIDPVGVAEQALAAVAEGERQIADAEALLPAAEARLSLEARASHGWWYLVGALALGGIVILVGQQVF